MIGALAQKAAMPASPLGDLMPPEGAGFSLPTGFAELLGRLGLIGRGEKPALAASAKADGQLVVTSPATEEGLTMASVLSMLPPGIAKAFAAPGPAEDSSAASIATTLPPGLTKAFVAPTSNADGAIPVAADADGDDGAVPEGLEEIAETALFGIGPAEVAAHQPDGEFLAQVVDDIVLFHDAEHVAVDGSAVPLHQGLLGRLGRRSAAVVGLKDQRPARGDLAEAVCVMAHEQTPASP